MAALVIMAARLQPKGLRKNFFNNPFTGQQMQMRD
jgi:hypothetical protein